MYIVEVKPLPPFTSEKVEGGRRKGGKSLAVDIRQKNENDGGGK